MAKLPVFSGNPTMVILRPLPVLVILFLSIFLWAGCAADPQYRMEREIKIDRINLKPMTISAVIDTTLAVEIEQRWDDGTTLVIKKADLRSLKFNPFLVEGNVDLTVYMNIINDWTRNFSVRVKDVTLKGIFEKGETRTYSGEAGAPVVVPKGGQGQIPLIFKDLPISYRFDPESRKLHPTVRYEAVSNYVGTVLLLGFFPFEQADVWDEQVDLPIVDLKQDDLIDVGGLTGQEFDLPRFTLERLIDLRALSK
ncbi:MAG: hypothetical protein HYY09_00120 [Firmicutes bacterium]|nr:hypothetical protein [Bacillota bacterium]